MADSAGAEALEAELRAELPAGVRALDDACLADLAKAVRDTRHGQAAALAEAGEQALRHVPKLLRIPLRKALG
jgi:hypothetical protein